MVKSEYRSQSEYLSQLKSQLSKLKDEKRTVLEELTDLEKDNSNIKLQIQRNVILLSNMGDKQSKNAILLVNMADQQSNLDPADLKYKTFTKTSNLYKKNINEISNKIINITNINKQLNTTYNENNNKIFVLKSDEDRLSAEINDKSMIIRRIDKPLLQSIKESLKQSLNCTGLSGCGGKGKIIKTKKYKFKIKNNQTINKKNKNINKKNKTVNKKNKKFIKKSKKYRIKRNI